MHKRSPIFHSVGVMAANLATDVATVQRLLNGSAAALSSPLAVDGRVGPTTVFAIRNIQRRFLRMTNPDGRVDPHGETIRFLSASHPDIGPLGGLPSFSHVFDNLLHAFQASGLGQAAGHAPSQAPATPASVAPASTVQIAWGAKVSADFKARVIEICKDLELDPNFLMSCMAFESGETFSASIKNKTSSATGLIQFMSSTAKSLGTTTADLAKMTDVKQLDYVKDYFQAYKGKLKTIEDTYMVILWPAAVGKDNSYVLFSKPSIQYTQNAGLDADKDGVVTKAEAAAPAAKKLEKGQKAGYLG